MQTIEIKDIGPVKHLTIPVPEGGGVTVLRGRNGRGKTRSIEAVESALNGQGKIEVRDGALRGEVEAFGISIKVGRSTRRSGELEVQSLEGRLSVAELVDPGIKSPEAADAKRIKALVQLTGIEAKPELFHEIIGGQKSFESHITPAAIATTDLVTMAERIKRDLEAAARKAEASAEHAEGHAKGSLAAAAGVDVSQECDPTILTANLEAAVTRAADLQAQTHAHRQATIKAQEAQTRLQEAQDHYEGIDLDAAKLAEEQAQAALKHRDQAVEVARQVLAQAESAAAIARNKLAQAIRDRKHAEQHTNSIAEWKQAIEESIPPAPTTESVQQAADAVINARQALEAGALIRNAMKHLADAEFQQQNANAHRKGAELLRTAARNTDLVLSQAVAKLGCGLRVEAGRLVLDTRRGSTYYGDLSAGERWRIALDLAIDVVGENGVLTIAQEAWEGLDPTNRRAIAEHVQGRGVLIITAEASDDEEITAEVFA